MKTKIFIIVLFTAVFGLASQAQAQDVLRFTDVVQTNGNVKARIYTPKSVTVRFMLVSNFGSSNNTGLSLTYKIGPRQIIHPWEYLNHTGNKTEYATITLYPGWNDVHCYFYTGIGDNINPYGYVYMLSVESGNAVIGSPSYIYFCKQ